MDMGDRSEASNGGPSSCFRGAGELSSAVHSTTAGSEFAKTLVVAVDSLKVKSLDGDDMCTQFLLSPKSSGCSGKHGGKGKSAISRKTVAHTCEYDFDEDIIDGFAISSFSSFEDLEEFVSTTASGKLLKPKCASSTSNVLKSGYADESSRGSSSCSNDESNTDNKLLRLTVLNKHAVSVTVNDTNSNHSRASEGTTAMDLADLDERPPLLSSPDDIIACAVTPRSNSSPQVLSIAVGDNCGSSVLRVPTPSSWERYKLSADNNVPFSVDKEMKDSATLVVSAVQIKPCECAHNENGGRCSSCKPYLDSHCDSQKVSLRTSLPIESQRAVATSPMTISIKIEDSSPPPPSLQQDFVSSKALSSSNGHFENIANNNDRSMTKLSNRIGECRDEKPVVIRDSKRHGSTYAGSIKSKQSSPERLSCEIRSVSRSPSVQRCHSRSLSSRHSIEIKSEQSTPPPPAVKKLSSHHSASERSTPRCSNPVSAPTSYSLYTPSAVPASYLSHVSNPSSFHYSSSFDSGLSYPFRGLANPSNSLFVPPPPSININPSLMMGLQNQFGHDALLNAAANQEVLNRMQQELNSRFLHDRSMLPLGLPSVPFTLHTEMHQHLHHHQHVVTPSYLQPPGSTGLFSNQMSMNLNELAERERFAKMASLSGLSSLNVAPGMHNGLSFNQGLHSGAFQPKIPSAASAVSNLNPASQLLLSIRDHENLARNPSITSMSKRRGRWCAAHVQIAWKIHQHKQNKVADAAAFRASLDAAEMASLRAGFGAAEAASMRAQASTDRLRSGLLGGLARPAEIHARLLGQGIPGCPPHYSGLDMLGRLAQTGLDLNSSGLFGPPPVNPSISILRPQVGPSPAMSHRVNSPAPHQTVKPKPEPSRRETSSDRHGASSSSSGHSHRTSVEVKSEHNANRHRDHHGRPPSSSHTVAAGSVRRSSPADRDRHLSRHRDRSRSRSPLSSRSSQQVRHPNDISAGLSRASDMRGPGKEPDAHIGHQRFGSVHGEQSSANMLSETNSRNGFPPSGHAFSSVTNAHKPPAVAKVHMSNSHLSTLELEHDARQQALRQQHERDRLSFGASAAAAAAASGFAASLMPTQMFGSNCDAATAMLLRDRMITDQRDRMLLAAAAAEYESRSLRNTDHSGLRQAQMQSFGALYQPQLPPPHGTDGLLGGTSGMMFAAAQSLHRPSLNQSGPPGLKLPSTYGSILDSSVAGSLNNAASHLNLPFR